MPNPNQKIMGKMAVQFRIMMTDSPPIAALVECLKKSVLGHALTYTPIVPATLVHRAHYTSNALFDANNQVKSVFYETIDNEGNTKKVQLTKEKFAEALHLPIYNSKEMVVPSADQLVAMFNEMGYEPLLEKISMFKKAQLPDLWRYFFSIFLRCLSRRTSGLDSASGCLSRPSIRNLL
ncbi:hypothetical protein L1887_36702 [Cichorium endivia]|nr:hypothetical protein L1887_36702 [Cichorium endivia]